MRIKMTHAIHDAYDPDIHGCEGPLYEDGCGHRRSEYLGSVQQIGRAEIRKYDVYVHDQDGVAHVCIRCGDEGSDYVSAGTVLDFLASAARNPRWYPAVAALLLAKLDFFCERAS